MTPPKESGTEAASEPLGWVAETPEQIKAKLLMNGPDSSGLPRLPEGEAMAIADNPIPIPVNVVERGSMLPPQAEFKISDDALTLDQIHAEANSELTDAMIASLEERKELAPVPALSEAERIVRNTNMDPSAEVRFEDEKALVVGYREALSGARDLRELKEKAEALASQGLIAQESVFAHGVKGVEGPDPLTTLTKVETDEGEESVEGWFKPIPGDRNPELVMLELERAKNALDKRGKIQRARDRISVKGHHRETDKTTKAATEALSYIREHTAKEKAKKELTEKGESWIEEAKTFDEYMVEKIAETRRPFEIQIAKLRRDKEGLSKLTSILVDKKMESERLTKKIGEQQMLMLQAENKTRLAIRKEIPRLSEEATVETSKVRDLLGSVVDGKVVYEPENGRDPDSVVAISRSISDTVGRQAEHINSDEYKLGDTVMQRLVYKTEHEGVVVIEDWDKSAGILKRQVVMKGKDLLVPDYENGEVSARKAAKLQKKGQYTMELSKQAHEDIGLIKLEQVASDASTSYEAGSFAYAGRLKRSGVSSGGAYEMASGAYKPRESKGFIAMLRANLEASKKR